MSGAHSLLSTYQREVKDVKLPYPYNSADTLQEFLTANNMTPSNTTFLALALIETINETRAPVGFVKLPLPIKLSNGTDVKHDERKGDGVPAGGITNAMLSLYDGFRASRHKFYVDLVMAHQVKSLKPRNVTNYFRAANIDIDGDILMRHLNYMKTAEERLIGDPQFQEVILADKWLKYHTTYSSTGALVMRTVNALNAVSVRIRSHYIGEKQVEAAKEAEAAPWDVVKSAAISQGTICTTYWFLKATKQLPDNWYQGEKAKDNAPPFEIARMVAVFEKMMNLGADTSEISSGRTVSDLERLFRG